MDTAQDIREFLTTRRARISPDEAGLPGYGAHRRRVPGLRREEVAMLAGVSTEYYVRLERGNAKGVSEAVLEGISRALQLDEAERAHLHDLVRAANAGLQPHRRREPSRPARIRRGVQQLLDAMTDVPAIVQNGRGDIVAANRLGRAFYSEMYRQPQRPANFGRFVFLDPASRLFFPDWDGAARQTVALLRSAAGRQPDDRDLRDLIGELSMGSECFRTLWAAHDVRLHHFGAKRVHHPIVGDLDLTFEALELTSDQGLSVIAYSATPGTPSRDALQLLANWAATHEQELHPQTSVAPTSVERM
jgi:transcriptional regulator with XRE-family HTH domain